MEEIHRGFSQGHFCKLLISKKNIFRSIKIQLITFQVVFVTRAATYEPLCLRHYTVCDTRVESGQSFSPIRLNSD
jgi:hypothetical protein